MPPRNPLRALPSVDAVVRAAEADELLVNGRRRGFVGDDLLALGEPLLDVALLLRLAQASREKVFSRHGFVSLLHRAPGRGRLSFQHKGSRSRVSTK